MNLMNPEIKKRWVDALRSGTYKQGQSALRQETTFGGSQFCCLGVLCDLYIKEHPDKVDDTNSFDTNDHGMAYYFGAADLLPKEVVDWAGFDESVVVGGLINGSINQYGIELDSKNDEFAHPINLAGMNDEGQSFHDISIVIEEHL